jgi:hypothetical protein
VGIYFCRAGGVRATAVADRSRERSEWISPTPMPRRRSARPVIRATVQWRGSEQIMVVKGSGYFIYVRRHQIGISVLMSEDEDVRDFARCLR